MKKHNRRVGKCIEQVYTSLVSHIPYTHEKSEGGKRFHKKCVKEYARLIVNLSKLYQ